ncbi:MAG: serine/threonine-protein kinase PknK [Myxococcales bacterium]|nr:serine/threonine-protein kinase PknK [Myxococcales bacterium]
MKVGDIVAGRFVVQRVAGSGAMGTVFCGHDAESDKFVAIKVLHTTDEKLGERFEREAEILHQLDDPGIVRHIASGETDDHERYLIMEWLEGLDLGQRLMAGTGLTVAESVTLARRAAAALGKAHDLGIIHRDIKPSNLYLLGGDPAEVKVLDFGVARLTGQQRRTATGATLGTPAYMAPEQAAGMANLDSRVDVFALGSVLFECLTGQPAFPGESLMEILSKVLFQEPPQVLQVRPDLPEALNAVVARMMARDQNLRYRDGHAVAAALSGFEAMRGDRPKSAAYASLTLTGAERRFISIVVLGVNRLGETPDATMSESDLRTETRLIKSTAKMFGFRIENMPDGSVIAIQDAIGVPTEQIERAARYALRLREHVPGAPLALVTGWGVMDNNATLSSLLNNASELLKKANVDGVRIDSDTAALLDARFEVAQREGEGWVLEREQPATDAIRVVNGKVTQYVGRQQELAMLDAAFAQCIDDGEARVVLVTAPAGMGKSRLAFEFVRRIEQSHGDMMLLQGRGDPLGAAAYGLLALALRRAATAREGEAFATQRTALRNLAKRWVDVALLDHVTDFLGEMVGIRSDDTDNPQLRAARADPTLMGSQVLAAWQTFMAAVTARTPALVVLEDVQYADLPSLRAIEAVLKDLQGAPLMVLALGRPELHERHPNLWRDRNLTKLELGRLPPKASERLVQQVLGRDIQPALVAKLIERSEGNPFCLEELMRHVAAGQRDSFPDSVLGMVQARLETLDPRERQVLRAASVYGQVFWLGGVAAMLGFARAAEAGEHLEGLVRRELVRRRPDCVFPGETEYGFASAMVHDAAYASLTGEDRMLGHRLCAKWLEAHAERNALVLAGHLERGGQSLLASAQYLRAAESTLESGDNEGTVTLAERGLDCGAAGEVRGRLRLVQAEVWEWQGKWADNETAAREAFSLLPVGSAPWFRAAGQALIASARFGQSPDFAGLAARIGAVEPADAAACGRKVVALCRGALNALWVGRYDLANALVRDAESAVLPLADGDLLALARLNHARAYTLLFAGDTWASVSHFERAADMWHKAGDRRIPAGVRTNLGFTLAQCGEFDRAEALLRVQAASAEKAGLSFLKLVVDHNLGTVLALCGDIEAGVALKESAVRRLAQSGHPRLDGNVRAALAEVLWMAGRLAEAEDEALAAVALLPPFPPTHAYSLGVLARVQLDLNRPAEALASASLGMAIVDRLGGLEEGEDLLRLVWAEALAACGRSADARVALQTAVRRLHTRAADIPDAAGRARFLRCTPARAQTFARAAELDIDPAPAT